MNRKICEECRVGFQASRKTQRFCSKRCADRKRDRLRRIKNRETAARSNGFHAVHSRQPDARTSHVFVEGHGPKRRVDPLDGRGRQTLDALQTQLRSQASDLEHLEAVNAEQRLRISGLQGELAHLKRAQRINVQDLAHVAARLVAMVQAKGLPLDSKTVEILRRRGWLSSKRRPEARRP